MSSSVFIRKEPKVNCLNDEFRNETSYLNYQPQFMIIASYFVSLQFMVSTGLSLTAESRLVRTQFGEIKLGQIS